MSTATAPQRTAGRRSALRRYLPPQHGAWAMLLLPYLAGVLAVGFRWRHAPLIGAWLAGYLLSYYASQAVKTGSPRRFRAQLVLYAPLTTVLVAVTVATSPAVLRYAPAYALLLGVSLWYARRRRERALGNDLVLVLASCLMVPVTATVAGSGSGLDSGRVSAVGLLVFGYLGGTIPHVKSMIRERDDVRYRWASLAWHALALAGAALLGPMPGAVFALLALRAWVLPRHRLAPKWIGIVEIVASVLVLVAAWQLTG